MSTKTAVLTIEQIRQIGLDAGCDPVLDDGGLVYRLCRGVEQAVLQSPEIRGLVQALQVIAKYPATRDEEMSMNSVRATARHALSGLEQKP